MQPAHDEAMEVAVYNLEDWRQLDEQGSAPSKATIGKAAVPDIRDPDVRRR